MAKDVAELMIVLGTKGAKTAVSDLDKLKTSTKQLKTETDKAKSTNQKFGDSMNSVRQALAPTAAAVWLVQGAYRALKGAVDTVNEAYHAQYSAEIKMQTIMKTTNNAIGMNADQVYALTQKWQDLTGVNDAVIMNAVGMEATFTSLAEGVFPDLLEQAFNMSTVFSQDLNQSIIQIGTAVNNLETGRLRRVGISFTQTQNDMVRAHREAGETAEGQRIILEELEREIGQVARAMGDSSLGIIKKYNNAWTNLFEEVGEKSTNFWAELIDNSNMKKYIEQVTKALSEDNSLISIAQMEQAGLLTNQLAMSMTPLHEIQEAYKGIDNAVAEVNKKNGTFLLGLFGREERSENIQYLKDLKIKLKEILDWRMMEGDADLKFPSPSDTNGSGEDDDSKGTPFDYMKWLSDLAKATEIKQGLLDIEKEGDQFDREHLVSLNAKNAIIAEGVEHNINEADILQALNGYYDNVTISINEQEAAYHKLQESKAKVEAIKLYGTEEEQRILKQQEDIAKLDELFYAGGLGNMGGVEKYLELLEKLKTPSVEIIAPDKSAWDLFTDSLIDSRSEAQRLADVLTDVKGIGMDFASGVFLSSFESLGASIAGANDEGDNFKLTTLKMGKSALDSAGPIFFAAAATEALARNWTMAAAYLGLAAAAGFGSGVLGQGINNESDKASSSSIPETTYSEHDTDLTGAFDSGKIDRSISVAISDYGNNNITTSRGLDSAGKDVLEIVVGAAVDSTASTYNLSRPTRNVG